MKYFLFKIILNKNKKLSLCRFNHSKAVTMKTSTISSVKIYNLNGTVVQVFNKPKTFNNHILKAGMYLAVIEWNNKKIERQLIQIRQNKSENEKSF